MKFRKKPVVIEAIQWTGRNLGDMHKFMDIERLAWNPIMGGGVLFIRTLEGEMQANTGDWIIKGVKGEFYPIKDHIFRQTYEEVKDA